MLSSVLGALDDTYFAGEDAETGDIEHFIPIRAVCQSRDVPKYLVIDHARTGFVNK